MRFFYFISILAFLISCNQKTNDATNSIENGQADNDTAANSFFPLGNFIKGQIVEIKNNGINPIIFKKINNKEDSSWVKVDEFEQVFSDFYTPFIDSVNMQPYFKEDKFFDQTLNVFTLTYTATGKIPDNISWRYWNVYIDPETEKVTKIFMVKEEKNGTTKQMTWIPGSGAKIISINNNNVDDEINLKWSYK